MSKFDELFDKAVASINEFATYDDMEKLKDNSDFQAKLNAVESKMNQHWNKSYDDFRAALIEMFKLYKTYTGGQQ